MKPFNKKVLLSLLITIGIFAFIFAFPGVFVEDYEALFNYMFYNMAAKNTAPPALNDLHFLSLQAIFLLQKILLSLNVYLLYKCFILAYSLFLLSFTLLKNNKYLSTIIALGIIMVVSLDAFIFIHANKLVVLLIICSGIFLFFHKESKFARFIFFMNVFLVITVRVDLSLIVIFICLVFALTHFRSLQRTFYITAFVFSICANLFFANQVSQNLDNINEFYKFERAVQDRQDLAIIKSPFNKNLTLDEAKLYGIAYFLLDEKALQDVDASKLIKHQDLKSYIFHNPEFISIYKNKLNRAFNELVENYSLFLFLGFSSCFLFFLWHLKTSLSVWRSVIFLLVYISIPLAINVIATLDINFLSIYILSPFLVVFFYVFSQKRSTSVFGYRYILLIFLLILGITNYCLNISNKIAQHKAHNEDVFFYLNEFKKDKKQGKTSIVSYIEYQYFLPTDIRIHPKDFSFVFLDAGPYNYLEHFQYVHEDFFGENYSSFAERTNVAVAKNGYLYSSENTLIFMQTYLDLAHNIELQTSEVPGYENHDFKKYQIWIND